MFLERRNRRILTADHPAELLGPNGRVGPDVPLPVALGEIEPRSLSLIGRFPGKRNAISILRLDRLSGSD